MTIDRPNRRPLAALALVACLAVVASACSSSDDRGGRTDPTAPTAPTTTTRPRPGPVPLGDEVRIEVLSSQPDRVSGDDAHVRVSPPAGATASDLRLTLGGVDVTDRLEEVDGSLEGVVTGLIEGNNTLEATHGDETAVQRIRAWPLTGPIISGPHLPLLVCSTEEHGLGAPTDDDCSAPSKVTWRYLTVDGAIADLPADVDVPADLAFASIDGTEVPLYVRVEEGVINRSVYEIASVDPTPRDEDPTGTGWNGKLVYRYGGGCGTTYGQGESGTTAADPAYLRQGYALATATFNTFAVQCNDVLSAETTMMVKERVVEALGVPSFTIGEGGSGGAIQLHLMAQNYPGLIDGAVALQPFPDALSIAPGVTDCGLLLNQYENGASQGLSAAQRTAVNGHATDRTCQSWSQAFLAAIDPTVGCDPKIAPAEIYDPRTNPGGLRCTLQDANRNQLGIDEATGWARRPLDNVGVQYGLEALNDGILDAEEFLDLNERIGGYDLDGQIVDERTEADPEAVMHAYETGRISMGGGDQAAIPIIDVNFFADETGDIHDRFRAFSLRDRLAWSGDPEQAPGFQIWTRDPGSEAATALDAVAVVDAWLTALHADTGGGDIAEVLARTRPDEAVDNCLPAAGGEPLRGVGIYEQDGRCADDFPLAGDPRTAAGGPRSAQVLKCTLKPVDPLDYERRFTDAQYQRLQDIFASGVCDWTQPSIGETTPASPDRSYDDVESPAQSA